MQKPQKLIIASYRLPLKFAENRLIPADGGLIAALGDSGITEETTWVGCLGKGSAVMASEMDRLKNEQSYVNVPIGNDFHDDFYDGFCNQVIWPSFHERADLIHMEDRFWPAYRRANDKFAECILMNSDVDVPVWVQDYHLMMLPMILKQYQKKRKVGFFLHIPWPNLEVAQKTPHLDTLAEALLECDTVVFQNQAYADNFCSFLKEQPGGMKPSELESFFKSRVKVVPIGINASRFQKPRERGRLHSAMGGQSGLIKMIGVDRLDYSKGIDFKFHVYDQLLEVRPELHGEINFSQLLIPTREAIPAYIEYKERVLELAEHINLKYGTDTWQPLEIKVGRMRQDELHDFYKTADLCFVSSCRDGMNLVSMEFLAAQNGSMPGALVLSDRAGSAEFLGGALLFNANSVDDAVKALSSALDMDNEEARQRLEKSMSWIKQNSARRWALKNLSFLGIEKESLADRTLEEPRRVVAS